MNTLSSQPFKMEPKVVAEKEVPRVVHSVCTETPDPKYLGRDILLVIRVDNHKTKTFGNAI